jgi:hypothetical protein
MELCSPTAFSLPLRMDFGTSRSGHLRGIIIILSGTA